MLCCTVAPRMLRTGRDGVWVDDDDGREGNTWSRVVWTPHKPPDRDEKRPDDAPKAKEMKGRMDQSPSRGHRERGQDGEAYRTVPFRCRSPIISRPQTGSRNNQQARTPAREKRTFAQVDGCII